MTTFPLPLDWVRPVGWDCFLWDAPVVDGAHVVARCGPRILTLAVGDGAVASTWNLPGTDRFGQVFARAGRVWVADVTLDGAPTLVGVSGGAEAWRTPLGGVVDRDGWLVGGDRLFAVVNDAHQQAALIRVDTSTGTIEERLPLRRGGSLIAATPDGPLIGAPAAAPGAPGAYIAGSDGDASRVIRTGGVWRVAASGAGILTVGDRQQQRHVLDVRLPGGTVRWSAECHTDVGALDGAQVAHAERDGTETSLVVRDAATGAVAWRAPLGTVEPTVISFAGPVVLVRHLMGMIVAARADGRVLGDEFGEHGFRAAVAGDRLFLGGDREILAARLDGLG